MAILPGGDPEKYTIKDVQTLIGNAAQMMLSAAAIIAAIYIVIGAYNYFLAFGNEERATAAKKTITWAIVGIIVILLGKVIVTTAWTTLSPTTSPDFLGIP